MKHILQLLKYPAECWTGFWFAEMSPYPMALFRSLFGCYLLLYFLGGLNHISLFYSNVGVYCPVLIPDVAPSPFVAFILYCTTIGLILALTIGYRVRIVAPLTLIFYLYHFCLNIWVRACSYDRLVVMALIILCLAPSDQVLSVTPPKRQTDVDPTVSAWPARLLALHISLFYLSTGIYKVLSPDWHTGRIIKGVMTSEFSSDLSFAVVGLKLPPFLFDIMAVSVIIFELLCPFGFLIRDLSIKLAFSRTTIRLQGVQYYFFLAGILFHIGIAIFMQIPQFFICPVYYVLFMPGGDIKTLLTRAQERFPWMRGAAELVHQS
jgi:Vitamin K-dependent gamma-carboxylase